MTERTTKYLVIAEDLADSIRMRKFYNGDRLPAQRDLAAARGVTIGTITRAYGELERLGLAVARVGDGTYVRYDDTSPAQAGTVNLAYNVPIVVPEVQTALRAALQRIASDNGLLLELLNYQSELGLMRHRESGAHWLSRLGLSGDPGRIMVTNGAQHGLASVLRTFAQRGDVLLTESLGYHGLLPLAQQLGLQVVGVDTDSEGLEPHALQQAIRTYKPRWLYCIPTLQMPTGTTMSSLRRKAVAAILQDSDVLLIEDCVHALLLDQPLPALSSWLPDRAFLLASLSKVVAPGLRQGYVEADPRWFGNLASSIRADSLMTAPLLAEVVSQWFSMGCMDELMDAQRQCIARRRQIATEVLNASDAVRGGLLEYNAPPDFPFVWISLRNSAGTSSLEQALRARVVVVRLSNHFRMGRGQPSPGLRLSLGSPTDDAELRRGIALVVSAIEAQAK